VDDPGYTLLATPPANFRVDGAKVVRIISDTVLQWGGIANCLHLKRSDSGSEGPGHGLVHCIREDDLRNEGGPGDHNIQLTEGAEPQPDDHTSRWVKITHSEVHNRRGRSETLMLRLLLPAWEYGFILARMVD
jgi:hypothetical protein